MYIKIYSVDFINVFRLKRREAIRSAKELSLVYSKLHRIYLIDQNSKTSICLLLGFNAINMAESADSFSESPHCLGHMYILLAITLKQCRYSLFQYLTKFVFILWKLFEIIRNCSLANAVFLFIDII